MMGYIEHAWKRPLITILLALAIAQDPALPASAQNEAVGAKHIWCQIDDPASYRAARQVLIDAGRRDLENIDCPDKLVGSGLPVDLTLPMPCGRAMLFQRVDVPVSGLLDHVAGSFGRSVDIAAETPQTVLSNGAWNGVVAGAFSIDADGKRVLSGDLDEVAARAFYMGRYELTALQWAIHELGLFDLPAEMTTDPAGDTCAPFEAVLAKTNLRSILPVGGLSWYDANDFARAYSRWLVERDAVAIGANRAPELPWEQGATGYVRLPTEAEWEFAARGGASFTTNQSRSLRLPMVRDPDTGKVREAEITDVCADAPRESGQLLAPVGRNLPNLLGLYDVICNAEEIVLDLFRPTRPDGLAGHVGGVVTKGGNSILFRDKNTVGRRSEAQALFTSKGEGRTGTMGVRLAISAPVFAGRRDAGAMYVEGLSNEPFEAALIASRQALLEAGVGLADSPNELEAEVNKLRRAVAEGELTQEDLTHRMSGLTVELERLQASLRARAEESVRLLIRSGVVTGNLIDRIGRNMFAGMQRVEELQNLLDSPGNATQVQISKTRAAVARASDRLMINEERIQAAYDLYLQVHSDLASADSAFVFLQIQESRRGLSGASIEVFGPYLETFEAHHKEVRRERGQITESMRKTWLEQLDSVRVQRRSRFPNQQL